MYVEMYINLFNMHTLRENFVWIKTKAIWLSSTKTTTTKSQQPKFVEQIFLLLLNENKRETFS